jgi:hypothetical protein
MHQKGKTHSDLKEGHDQDEQDKVNVMMTRGIGVLAPTWTAQTQSLSLRATQL